MHKPSDFQPTAALVSPQNLIPLMLSSLPRRLMSWAYFGCIEDSYVLSSVEPQRLTGGLVSGDAYHFVHPKLNLPFLQVIRDIWPDWLSHPTAVHLPTFLYHFRRNKSKTEIVVPFVDVTGVLCLPMSKKKDEGPELVQTVFKLKVLASDKLHALHQNLSNMRETSSAYASLPLTADWGQPTRHPVQLQLNGNECTVTVPLLDGLTIPSLREFHKKLFKPTKTRPVDESIMLLELVGAHFGGLLYPIYQYSTPLVDVMSFMPGGWLATQYQESSHE